MGKPLVDEHDAARPGLADGGEDVVRVGLAVLLRSYRQVDEDSLGASVGVGQVGGGGVVGGQDVLRAGHDGVGVAGQGCHCLARGGESGDYGGALGAGGAMNHVGHDAISACNAPVTSTALMGYGRNCD